jgi:hypothetical protein
MKNVNGPQYHQYQFLHICRELLSLSPGTRYYNEYFLKVSCEMVKAKCIYNFYEHPRFGTKREEVAGDWRILHNEKLHKLYALKVLLW